MTTETGIVDETGNLISSNVVLISCMKCFITPIVLLELGTGPAVVSKFQVYSTVLQ